MAGSDGPPSVVAETLFQSADIPFINITTMSVEEIAATVLHECNLQRRVV